MKIHGGKSDRNNVLKEDIAILRAVAWDKDDAETTNLVSFWDLVNQDTREYLASILEIEAATKMITSSPKVSGDHSKSKSKAIIANIKGGLNSRGQ